MDHLEKEVENDGQVRSQPPQPAQLAAGDSGLCLAVVPESAARSARPGSFTVRSHWTAFVSLVHLKVMSRSFTEIAEEALTLPQNEQLRLARTLLENAEASGDVGAEAAWEHEIVRRIRTIDSGLAKGRPFADVLRDIDRQLGG